MILICPNCGSSLSDYSIYLRCINGHTFDKAKEGYVNLILANQKRKLDPGDNKEMINAREAFLLEGHFEFLIDEVKEQLNILYPNLNKGNSAEGILDIGCGSGYYTRNLFKHFTSHSKIGLDISKNAVSKASKKDKDSIYVVGSAFQLPISDNTINLILNVFAPLDLNESIRVLNKGGYIVKVVPNSNHMKEVALKIYDTFKPHSLAFLNELGEYSELSIIEEIELTKTVDLETSSLKKLIAMTPYRYKFEDQTFDNLVAMPVTLAFKIIVVKLS